MTEDTILVDPSYMTCEINGSQFVFQTSENSPNTLIEVGTVVNNAKHINETIKMEKDNEESIPIICLDGVIYALQNGQLQELDLSKLQNVHDYHEDKDIAVLTDNHSEPLKEESSENIDYSECNVQNIESSDDGFHGKIERSDESRNFLIENGELNANDFVEVVAAFKCKICPFTSQDRGQLLKHFQNTHVNPTSAVNKVEDVKPSGTDDVKLLYMCGECSSCFPTMENCREHMINDHQLMDGACEKFDEDTHLDTADRIEPAVVDTQTKPNTSSKVNRQSKNSKTTSTEYADNKKNIQIKERTVKCMYRGCLHKFSTEEMMQKHVIHHVESQNSNVFKCNICHDLKFTKWKSCCSHLWKKHEIDIDLLLCNICNVYKSVSSVKLLTHMRVHSENRDFQCRDCGKSFKQASQLRNHRVMHLDRKAIEVPRWYTSKTCEMCGKTYADSKCLKNHMQAVHSKLRPYVCNVCGHSSARKAMLQMHLRQHTGDKPFNCDICDFKTGDHNSLRRHIMRHTGVRPYKCPHCAYSAIQSSSYKNHLKAKHPSLSGLFTCELCSFKTVKKESYLEHVGDHEKGLIKTTATKTDDNNVEVFPGNMAAAQLIYSCLGAFSKEGKTIEASLMSSSTSADGTSQTITIQIPSTHLESSLPMAENTMKNNSIEQEDEETMHCFLKIPHEEEESIDTGGITIPAEPEDLEPTVLNVES